MGERIDEKALRADLESRIDGYRDFFLTCLDGLTDDQAKHEPVSGQPGLLGLVRHVTFVEGVWFDEAITGRSRKQIGIPTAVSASLKARKSDTIATVLDTYRRRIDTSNDNLAARDLEHTVDGRGPRQIRDLLVHVLGELSWRAGQATIIRQLRELPPTKKGSRSSIHRTDAP